MEVLSAATHYIKKTIHQPIELIDQANAPIEASQQRDDLVEEILKTYNQRSAQQAGVFQGDGIAYPLSTQARRMMDGELTLLELSISMLGTIEKLMNHQVASNGGHLLFVHYRRAADDFLLIVKLQTIRGQIFKTLSTVEDATHLSVDTLQVAARINLSSWLDDRQERYVTFVSKREQGHASGYFRDFIGCDVEADPRTESKKFVAVIQDFVQAKREAGALTEDEAVSRLRHVFDHVAALDKGQPVVLDEVANIVWPADGAEFTGFLNQHGAPPVDHFYPDKRSLKVLVGYSFASKEFKLSMSHRFKADHNVMATPERLVIENPPARLVEELQQ